ncbi:MAG: c-type cytochrome [Thermodesulfobacteriota bacterium]
MANKTIKKYRFQAQEIVPGKILLFLALLLIIGCGLADQEVVSPNADPAGTFYSLAVLNRFDPGLNPETARGKELYLQNCFICHGESGDGKGFNAYNLKSNFGVQPFNFTDSSAVAKTSFDAVIRAITYGGPAVNKSQYMPPWGSTFSAYDLACTSSYVWHSLMGKKSK